jgi:hypothetical protein
MSTAPPFIVITTDSETTSPAERESITQLLRAKGWDVWHWMIDVWLVTGHPEDTKSQGLVKEIQLAAGAPVYVLVFVVPGAADLSAFLPHIAVRWLIEKFRPEEAAALKKSETAGSAE